MLGQPAISVIMSVYNGAQYLFAAVQSILDQDFTDFEFIILNDGSTDNSIAILNDFAARDPRIRLIDRANKGLVASLNELIAAARAPYLARMDADDVAMQRRLGLQYVFMEQHPEVGVLGTNTNELNNDGRVFACYDYYPDEPAGIAEMLKHRPALCHPSVMMRTETVRAIGGYRQAFIHAEDYDLWLRLSRQTQIRNLPERLLLYRRSDNQVSQLHAVQQSLSAKWARLAHEHVLAGNPDPLEGCSVLPPIEELDGLFDTVGLAAKTKKWLVEQSLYTDNALHGSGFSELLDQARSKTGFNGSWRTVLRLLKSGEPKRATVLGRSLIFKR
jgi:Glycosyl transferase family 2